jgi:hypothetical protein
MYSSVWQGHDSIVYSFCEEHEEMKPTTRFRFVIRYEQTQIRILQQWWGIEEDQTIGEWRDIPLEHEA